MWKLLAALIALTVAFVIASAVLLLVVWPSLFDDANTVSYNGLTNLGARVSEFQTLIGGWLAVCAAVLTAWVLYLSAALPIEAEKIRQRKIAENRRQAGAAVLFAAVSDLLNQLQEMIGASSIEYSGYPAVKPIEPHPTLLNIDVIGTQSPELIDEISFLLAFSVGREPVPIGELDPDARVASLQELDIAFDLCGSVLKKVQRVAKGDRDTSADPD